MYSSQDVQWNDIDYMDERNGFTVDPKNYNKLGDFVQQLHDEGRHYVLIVVSVGQSKSSDNQAFSFVVLDSSYLIERKSETSTSGLNLSRIS